MGSLWCSFPMWIVFSYTTSCYQFKRFASAKTNNNFGIGAHISLKLRVNETHSMSFISVSVLAKKLEAYIWLHCDVVTQTIYSKKIFHYLSPKEKLFYMCLIEQKNWHYSHHVYILRMKSWICYLHVAVEIMHHHRKK